MQQILQEYEYVQDGDIMIGGVVSVNRQINAKSVGSNVLEAMLCSYPEIYQYKNLMSFFYAVDEINKNPLILPNLTLGYHIYDSCTDPRKAIRSILLILSGPGYLVPNYSCTRKKKVVGFIGDHFSSTTLPIAQLLGIYPYTQISYGATDTLLSDRKLFPSFFRTVPNDFTTYSIISHFVSSFGWTWVGIISSDDDAGDRETKLLMDLLGSRGICVAFVLRCERKFLQREDEAVLDNYLNRIREEIKESSAQIIIICGTFHYFMNAIFNEIVSALHDRTFIINPTFTSQIVTIYNYQQIFNLSFLFGQYLEERTEMNLYMRSFHPLTKPNDQILEDLWITLLHCASGKGGKDGWFSAFYGINLHKCNGSEKLDILLFLSNGNTYQMHLAVHSLATALHNTYIYYDQKCTEHQMYQRTHKVHKYVKSLETWTKTGTSTKSFTDKGDLDTYILVYNDILQKGQRMPIHKIGFYAQTSEGRLDFTINKKNVRWKNKENIVPKSQCSPSCLPGQRKVPSPSIHLCCHDCAPCSEGEISNVSDSENCMKCPEDAWPNENRTFCVVKEMEYLSYNDDITIAFICSSLSFCILTIMFFAVFVLNRETPIVRANNKHLSFVLLVSIMLSFLCVFLFLGRPVDITCMLRQISTGIFLSVSISSLLAKTIMVYIAFKATRPGSVWRTWTGGRLPNCVLLICSSVQVVLCMSWVTLSPPFQELDTHSYKEKVVVQCNEGSDLWFYSVLGYMGVLAAVSFITAFLARTLPDSFNEAKYITFSMLVFCSVWIAMIPAYLSTRGKYMVAVEIFAILTSNAGLLGCIFLPKCYKIIFMPEINTRKHLLGRSYILSHRENVRDQTGSQWRITRNMKIAFCHISLLYAMDC
ncbi:vomeronasal type-2 receptor 26-like [Engystomops pustulosus]|uniref:vomeronasal type-2 receptor 26-like n=1 Tax=Engystomops pustulosus TaxID=76066 RepID=UPI003AFA48E5